MPAVKGVRARKITPSRELSMTSLLDALTIILVFLIKNISMETQRTQVPDKMTLPTTISQEKLLAEVLPLVIKIYPDRILIGLEEFRVDINDILSNEQVRTDVKTFLNNESSEIEKTNKRTGIQSLPALLIQGDKSVQCIYVSEIIKIAANAKFANIYFSTIKQETWLTEYKQ